MLDLLASRRAGVLLHVTSLPGNGAVGTLGAHARRFVDLLVAGGVTVWQTLPVGPVDPHGSPYAQRSAHAGNTRLIDPVELGRDAALPSRLEQDALGVDPAALYASFAAAADAAQRAAFAAFVRRARRWLSSYGLFELCARRFDDAPWWDWPRPHRERERSELRRLARDERATLRGIWFEQYLFARQWAVLKRYANERGVGLFGDLPFYVDRHSADVWWHRECFELDEGGRAGEVAGVPPDYFNADGQLWGNPLYDGQALARDGFAWWLARLDTQLSRFDLLRIDHFRALEAYWAVPASAATAREGRWRAGFGDALLSRLAERCDRLPLVAEDLGIITDEVRDLRDRFGLPGMAVLQFAFDGSPDNPHLPCCCGARTVIYTGTHDNDTTRGWLAGLDDGVRTAVAAMLGIDAPVEVDDLITAAYASEAALAVVPMQDWLGLGSEARMNLPGSVTGNWRWRFAWEQADPALAARMRALAERHARVAAGAQSRA